MKKKILCVLLALCLFASLLPMTALAADPDITVTFFNKGTITDRDNNTPGIYMPVTIKPGDPAKYIVTNAEGLMTEHTGDTAPADNYIKLEYPADGAANLKVTLKNIYIDSLIKNDAYHRPAIEFGAGAYSVNMELIGDNKIIDARSACIKNINDGGLTITGTQNSSLTLQMGTSGTEGASAAALWAEGGNLVIKNTTLNFEITTSSSSQHNSILSTKGNVLLENVTIKNKTNNKGKLVFTGLATAKEPRYTIDTDATRTVTIKNCNIDSQTGGTMIRTVAPVTIINSTIKATGKAPLFEGKSEESFNKPTMEGEYSGACGDKKNAEKPTKWKELGENMKNVKNYTFLYIVPGKVDLIPEPETTVPEETTPVETTKPVEDNKTEETTPVETTTPVEETQPVEATKPVEETKPVEGTKPVEETKPVTDSKDDASEEKSGSPLKIILIILIVLVVLGGGAVAAILILRNKNAEGEEGEEEEEAEETEEETEE